MCCIVSASRHQSATWWCLFAITMIVGSRRSSTKPTAIHCSLCRAWSWRKAWWSWWPMVASAVCSASGRGSIRHHPSVTCRAYDERLDCSQQQARRRRRRQLWRSCTKIWGTQETQIDIMLWQSSAQPPDTQYFSLMCIYSQTSAVVFLSLIMTYKVYMWSVVTNKLEWNDLDDLKNHFSCFIAF